MRRFARTVAGRCTHHITQRGNNRENVFLLVARGLCWREFSGGKRAVPTPNTLHIDLLATLLEDRIPSATHL